MSALPQISEALLSSGTNPIVHLILLKSYVSLIFSQFFSYIFPAPLKFKFLHRFPYKTDDIRLPAPKCIYYQADDCQPRYLYHRPVPCHPSQERFSYPPSHMGTLPQITPSAGGTEVLYII